MTILGLIAGTCIALANGLTFGLVMVLIVAKYTKAPADPEVDDAA